MSFKSRIYDYFIAGRYDRELAEFTDAFRKVLVDRIDVPLGGTVLDLGCGTGLNQPLLSERLGTTGSIVAIDASSQMLAQARARAERLGYADRVTFIHGDIRRVDELVKRTLDVVIATLIFSVVPDWRDVFRRSYALLKPGGSYGIMDNYWPEPTLRLWFLSWTYAANPKRPGFEPLQAVADEFGLEYHPPESDVQFYIAYGRKGEGAA